jgi:hypothetical protein
MCCAAAPEFGADKGIVFLEFPHLCGHTVSTLGERSVRPKASAYAGGEKSKNRYICITRVAFKENTLVFEGQTPLSHKLTIYIAMFETTYIYVI